MERLLVSACLMGVKCKYSGGANTLPQDILNALSHKYELVPVCPECDGGLPTPRIPSERREERVINKAGEDVTAQYRLGAEKALGTAEEKGCFRALFKERSPSCGAGEIYDGSFTKTLISGDGVTAELLKKKGIKIYGESRINELL